jgi:hypothetical protein
MKVKEYRVHDPIYHIFWELQVAELPECIATRTMEQIAGTGPGFGIRYGGTLHTVKSVVRAIPSSTVTPERPPAEGLPNLTESNASPTWIDIFKFSR